MWKTGGVVARGGAGSAIIRYGGRASTRKRTTIAALLSLMLLLSSPGMALGAVQQNVKVPLAGGVIPADDNPCSDEDLLHTSGNLHIKMSYTENQNRVSGTALFQPMGAKLVGVDTGDEYVGTGMFMETFNAPLDDRGAATTTFVSNFRVIGKGSAANLLIHEMGHLTINPDGTVTVEIESTSVECR